MNALMTVGDAAAALGCSVQCVRKMDNRGLLKATRTVGGYRLFDQAEVERIKLLRDNRPTRWHPIVPVAS